MDALVSLIAERSKDSAQAVVAISGGVDSGLAAWAARAALGDAVEAATVVSELTPGRETERARAVAEHIGIACRTIAINVLGDPRVHANEPDRCYHCKRLIFQNLSEHYGSDTQFIDGTNADDDPLRPGMKALREFGVLSPLREAGMGKAEVRASARAVGLPNRDTPSESCLATRIPHGIALSPDGLRVVETLETHCHGLGVETLRVRYDNLVAIVEFLPQYSEIMKKNSDNLVALARRIGVRSCEFKEWSE